MSEFPKDPSWYASAIRGEALPYSNLKNLIESEKALLDELALGVASTSTSVSSSSSSSSTSSDSEDGSDADSDTAPSSVSGSSERVSESIPNQNSYMKSPDSAAKNSPPIIDLSSLNLIRQTDSSSLSPLLRRSLAMETDNRSGEQRKHRHHHHHKNHSHSKSDLVIRERKLKQGRLLLVSLLENFCMLYDQSPEKNKRLFFLLCKQLSAMGIIESDDVLDEISAVRGAYKRAFKELVMQAMQAIHEETSVKSLPGPEGEGSQSDDLGNDSLALILKRQSIFQSGTSMSDKFESFAVGTVMGVITPSLNGGGPSQQHFADILDLHTSRYCEDFEENRVLGKGAFGQVWCVRNRLDDVQYAVKRISLKQSTTGMEKILREVKVQARLSHPNVVRYFSCWLEHAKPATKTAVYDDDAFGADSIDSTGYSVTNSQTEQSSEACDKSNQIPVPSKGCLPAAAATPLRRYYNNISDSRDGNDSDSGSSEEEEEIDWDDDIELEISLPKREHLDVNSSLKSNHPSAAEEASLYSASPSKQKSGSTSKDNLTLKELTLFIQMELCGSSLQFYLNHRNKAIFNPLYPNISETDFLVSINVPFCVSITRDICEGLDYIHSQGCIHRDIAPKNIFWVPSNHHTSASSIYASSSDSIHSLRKMKDVASPSLSSSLSSRFDSRHSYFEALHAPFINGGLWKIGDFGLVTITSDSLDQKDSESILSRMSSSFSGMTAGSPIPSPPTPSATVHSDVMLPDSHQSGMKYHTTGVGTESYASPEQLSKTTSMYSSKSDMYSAGIVFFELLHPIGTGMERARTFSNLRLGVLPEEFVKRFPKEATLVLWLMNKNPEDRPSARETLDLDLFASGGSSAGQSSQSKSFSGFNADEFSSSESSLSRVEASESKKPIHVAIPAVAGAGAGLHKRSLVENITSTVKSWIHHSSHREKAVASLKSMGIGNTEVECIVAHPERALEMIVDARTRAEKAEKEATDAKGEIARLKARIQVLEGQKVK
ncbi:hypothetical protein CcCBS67573_g06333 [Chytriomyces confervae]|uniref:non-specific serine/threonine protein kinase n=1 Tax=Chytriomyces confervae TaxID=246404 RepID=A0A507F420_9FUNG|nr:hypothetical protein CcCBS67573_g06333 [Chytriomyces confervae]